VVITLTGSAPLERTLLVYAGGTLELHGATNGNTTCWTQLAAHAFPGQSSLDLALMAPMNWSNGDKIVLAATDFPKVAEAWPASVSVTDQTEELTVAAMSGTTVDTQEPLQYFHHGEWIHSSVDARAEVGLLTRSIRIEGQATARGQVRFEEDATGDTTIHIDWTEFTNLGDVALANPLGGYPLHFHKMGNVIGSYVKYCSLHHNKRNNLVIHETSNLLVEGNVFYDTIGWHVWFQEETPMCTGNIVDGNLALVAKEDVQVVVDTVQDAAGLEGLGNAACFYVRNLNNVVKNNHAGSSWASGFYVSTAELDIVTGEWRWTDNHPKPTFENNLAHSCVDHGFYLGGWTRLPGGPPSGSSATFKNFTSYKNNGFGVFCRNLGTCVWDNPQLSDNGAGVYLASVGFWEEEYMAAGQLKGGRIVGESASNLGLFGHGLRRRIGIRPQPAHREDPRQVPLHLRAGAQHLPPAPAPE
jgi:hypothetical protein